MFYSIDIIIISFLILWLMERKGKLSRSKEVLTLTLAFLLLLSIKVPLLYTMDRYLVRILYPTYPTSHLSEFEGEVQATLLWSATLLVPVWGPYFYILQSYRAKYDSNFTTNSIFKNDKRKCEAVSFEFAQSDYCHSYLRKLIDKKIIDEALILIPKSRDYLNNSKEDKQSICMKISTYADFYADIGYLTESYELKIENCLTRECECRFINIKDSSPLLNRHQLIDLIEKQKKESLGDLKNDSSKNLRDFIIQNIHQINIDAAQLLIERGSLQDLDAAIEYVNLVLNSNDPNEATQEQIKEAKMLLMNANKKKSTLN